MEITQISENIVTLERQQISIHQECEKIKDQLKSVEDFARENIEVQADPSGKLIFSNEDKRRREVKRKLSENVGYVELNGKLKTLEESFEVNKIRIDKLKRDFNILLVYDTPLNNTLKVLIEKLK